MKNDKVPANERHLVLAPKKGICVCGRKSGLYIYCEKCEEEMKHKLNPDQYDQEA